MTSLEQLPAQDPYFSLDMRRPPGAGAVEVLLTGELDERTVEHLVDGLSWVFAHVPQQDVVIDLAGVCRLDRCGVEALLLVRSSCRRVDARSRSAGSRPVPGPGWRPPGLLALPSGG